MKHGVVFDFILTIYVTFLSNACAHKLQTVQLWKFICDNKGWCYHGSIYMQTCTYTTCTTLSSYVLKDAATIPVWSNFSKGNKNPAASFLTRKFRNVLYAVTGQLADKPTRQQTNLPTNQFADNPTRRQTNSPTIQLADKPSRQNWYIDVEM